MKNQIDIDPNKIVDEYGNTSLMLATKHSSSNTGMELLRNIFEDERTDVNLKAKNGLTCLMMACRDCKKIYVSSEYAISMLMSDLKTNIFIQDKEGNDVFSYCYFSNCPQLLINEMFRRQIKWQTRFSRQYSKSTNIPKDIWLIILLRNLVNKNKENSSRNGRYYNAHDRLKYLNKYTIFAQELHIPVKKIDTAETLYYKISEVLSVGTSYNSTSKINILSRAFSAKKAICDVEYQSQKLGILNTNFIEICTELNMISSIDWKEDEDEEESSINVKII